MKLLTDLFYVLSTLNHCPILNVVGIWISIYVQVCMQIQYISEKQGDKKKWHVIDSLLVMLNDMILCVPADSYGKIYLP